MLYLIVYELNKNKDYADLYATIKSYKTWWHYIDSAWIIKTNESANEISDRLTPHLDRNDNLLVIKIDPYSKQGWLSKKAWSWINRNRESR